MRNRLNFIEFEACSNPNLTAVRESMKSYRTGFVKLIIAMCSKITEDNKHVYSSVNLFERYISTKIGIIAPITVVAHSAVIVALTFAGLSPTLNKIGSTLSKSQLKIFPRIQKEMLQFNLKFYMNPSDLLNILVNENANADLEIAEYVMLIITSITELAATTASKIAQSACFISIGVNKIQELVKFDTFLFLSKGEFYEFVFCTREDVKRVCSIAIRYMIENRDDIKPIRELYGLSPDVDDWLFRFYSYFKMNDE